jgi:hypothetical protein
MKSFVSFASSLACAVALRTCVSGGKTVRIWASSAWFDTPGRVETAIPSSLPSSAKSFCAVGRLKPASVAPPIVETDPNFTMPEIRRRCTGPSAWTPIVWPIAKSSLPAVDLSMTTSLSSGQAPSVRVSGLNGESPRAMLKPRFGAPP